MGLPPSDVNVLVLDSREKVRAFARDFCDYLESIRIPANPSGEAVRSGDPMKGPLDFELETKPLIAALLHDKSTERRHLNQKLAVALSLAFGRNSLNFRLLTENDFIPSTSSSSQEGGVLRIPRIKKRRLYREVFTDEPIETFLSDLIRQVITSNQSICTTVSLSDSGNADRTPLLRPLFMRESPRKKILNSADYLYSFFMNRLELQNLLRDFVDRHQIYSPVTQSLLHLSFRRLRYTLATDAALSGTSIRGLALLLDQTGTQTARVYINASGRIVFILEQACVNKSLCTSVAMALIVVKQALSQSLVGRSLLFAIDGRVNTKTLCVNGFLVPLIHHLSRHFGDVFRVNRKFLPGGAYIKRLVLCGGVLGRVDELQFVHAPQYIELALLGAFWIGNRIY